MDDAQTYYETSIQIHETMYTSTATAAGYNNHDKGGPPELVSSYTNLAMLFCDQDNFIRAKPLLEKALQMCLPYPTNTKKIVLK